MKKRILNLFAIMIALGVGLAVNNACGSDAIETSSDSQLRSIVSQLQSEVNSLKTEVSTLKSELAQAQKDIAALQANGSSTGESSASAGEFTVDGLTFGMDGLPINRVKSVEGTTNPDSLDGLLYHGGMSFDKIELQYDSYGRIIKSTVYYYGKVVKILIIEYSGKTLTVVEYDENNKLWGSHSFVYE